MLFFESGDIEVFKADRNNLFASNEKQIDNHTHIFALRWCEDLLISWQSHLNALHASLVHVSCVYLPL